MFVWCSIAIHLNAQHNAEVLARMHNKGQRLYMVTLTYQDPKWAWPQTRYKEFFAPNRDVAVQAAKDFWSCQFPRTWEASEESDDEVIQYTQVYGERF
jgi:hypothetical protein